MKAAAAAEGSTVRALEGLAAVITAPGKIELRSVEFREPRICEVRVRIEGCGVCASNLPLWEGKPWFEYPIEPGAPGHEAWGRIDATGAGINDLAPGDRVAMLSSHGFAEYDFAPASQVVLLPESLDDGPFPGEALSCALNIFRRATIKPDDSVAIVGVGFLGTLLVQLAARARAKVLAISRRTSSLNMAKQFGAAAAVESVRALEVVKRLTQGRGCDCVIEAAGTQQSLDLASELTSEGGQLVIAGYHQDGPRQVNMQLWNWRGLDVINAHERNPDVYVQGIRAAIEAVETGVIDPLPLYTHTFSLDELPQAFEALASSREGFIKGLVVL
jgi:2-desacetyl-2-hydroxyethyl bacteriochlorophyllide A dehydrogenase